MGNKYIIKPGDSYWGVSKKLYGTGTLYPKILKVNNLTEKDVIHPGMVINIPKAVGSKNIPTKNEVHVIDNFSDKFDYIIEGNKVYKSAKNQNKYLDISDDTGAQKHLLKFLNDKYQFKGYQDGEAKIYQNLIKGKSSQQPLKKESKKLIVPFTKITEKADATRVTKPILSVKNNRNINNTKAEEPSILSNLFSTINAYIHRGYDKYIDKGNSDAQSKITLPKTKQLKGYSIIPGTTTGDTIIDRRYNRPANSQVYYLPENINLGDVRLGSRKRGDYRPISNTSGAVITSINGNITRYEDRDPTKVGPNWYFIGYDKNGKFKHGTYKAFSTGDTMVRVATNDFLGFAHDAKGNILNRQARGNRGYNSPQVYYLQNGKKKIGALNLLINKSADGVSRYGVVQGGRVLALVGNESRVISGSVKDIEKSLKDLQNRYPNQVIKLATLDNGTFNTGLRTKNHTLSSRDLRDYDNRNRGGGHFFYIIDSPQYQQKYEQSPNIRTTSSESYKVGHPLKNSARGIVFHHTAMTDPSLAKVEKGFMDPRTQRSSHVAIGYGGERIQFANSQQVTFHAGQSMFNGTPNVNDFMLGIEFQGRTDQKPLTDAQINSAIEWMTPIIRKYNIPYQNLTSHKRIRDEYNLHQRQNLIKKYHIPENELPNSLGLTSEYKKVLDKYHVAPADRPTWGKDVDIVDSSYNKLMEAVKKRLYYPTPKKQLGGTLDTNRQEQLGKAIYKVGRSLKNGAEDLWSDLQNKVKNLVAESANTTSVGQEWHGYPQTVSIFDLAEHPEATEYTTGLRRKVVDRTGDRINYDKPGSIHGKGILRAVAAVDANRTRLKQIYGLTDKEFDYYRSWIPAVMKTETSGGDSAQYDKKAPNFNWYNFESGRSGLLMYNPGLKGGTWDGKLLRPLKNFANNLAFSDNPKIKKLAKVLNVDKGESLGLGNVKVASEFTPTERRNRGYNYIFTNKNLRESAESSGLATMESLIRKGKYFNNVIKPKLIKNNITDQNTFDAMYITGYNQGYNNINTNVENYNPKVKGSYEKNILPYVGDHKKGIKGTSYYENTSYLRSLTDWQPSKIVDYKMQGYVLPEVVITAKRKKK